MLQLEPKGLNLRDGILLEIAKEQAGRAKWRMLSLRG